MATQNEYQLLNGLELNDFEKKIIALKTCYMDQRTLTQSKGYLCRQRGSAK